MGFNSFGSYLEAVTGEAACVSLWIKTSNVENWAGLEFVVGGSDNKVMAEDDMGDRPIHGTTDWQQCKVVVDVPKEAAKMVIFCDLHGSGELWYDDCQIDVAGPDVPITDNQVWHVVQPVGKFYAGGGS